ncbi:MAG TPA: hypothetical protein VK797_05540 [Tepidisphaeraceae bacterium]|nr:hypothetical protein [Tepidisphaeraceae bacterium]
MLRAVERAGLGLLGGCAAGLPLVAIAIWRGLPAVPLALTAICLGIACGMIWGWLTRPTLLAAAMEADRQLQSADLLSSALTVSATTDDPWARAVLREADRWSTMHSPSSVLLNRMGARAWGGVGLATALLILLALLPAYASPTRAGQNGAGSVNLLSEEGASLQSQPSRPGSFSRRTPVEQEPEDARPSRMTTSDQTEQDQIASQTAEGQAHESASRSGDARGAGESHSRTSNQEPLANPQTAAKGRDQSASGRAAAGVGQTADHATSGAGVTAATPVAPRSVPNVPPWRSSHWASDIEHAEQAVQSGQVPDQYRDMIRGYFDRAKDR